MDVEQQLGPSGQPAQGGSGKPPGSSSWVGKAGFTFIALVILIVGVILAGGLAAIQFEGTEVAARVTGVRMHSSRTYHHGQSSTSYSRNLILTFNWNNGQVSEEVSGWLLTGLNPGDRVDGRYLPGNWVKFLPLGYRDVLPWLFVSLFLTMGLALSFIGIFWWPPSPPVPKWMDSALSVGIVGLFLLAAVEGGGLAFCYFATRVVLTARGIYENTMVHHVVENLSHPLLAPGVATAPMPTGGDAALCPPMHLTGLSKPAAVPGEDIDLRGEWGTFTPNKVPVILGRGDRARLEVMKWSAEDVRVKVPQGLNPGKYQVDVWCHLPPLHRGGSACAHSSSPQCTVTRYAPAGARVLMITG